VSDTVVRRGWRAFHVPGLAVDDASRNTTGCAALIAQPVSRCPLLRRAAASDTTRGLELSEGRFRKRRSSSVFYTRAALRRPSVWLTSRHKRRLVPPRYRSIVTTFVGGLAQPRRSWFAHERGHHRTARQESLPCLRSWSRRRFQNHDGLRGAGRAA